MIGNYLLDGKNDKMMSSVRGSWVKLKEIFDNGISEWWFAGDFNRWFGRLMWDCFFGFGGLLTWIDGI